MRILLKTPINNDLKSTYSKFNRDLFNYLKPPLVSLNIKRFDGCKTGDEFHLEIGLAGMKQNWIGQVTADRCHEDLCFFIDEGKQLPAPLSSWKHIHRVIKTSERTCQIEDDITYSTGNKFLDAAIYPVMYLQFAARIPLYKKYLSKKATP